jgi:hypothetical protein
MRSFEPLRLALLALLIVLLQLAWFVQFPGWRATADLYVVFLLLVSAGRGPALAGALALAGGAIIDAYSGSLVALHLLYYMLPVTLGSLVRSHMLIEYRLLGSLVVFLLLIGKVLAQFLVAACSGWIGGPGYLLKVNYWPALFISAGVYAAWPTLMRLLQAPTAARIHGR